MIENFKKTEFDILKEKMEAEGFNYWKIDGLFETRGISSKDNNNQGVIFKTEQFQTKEDIINKIKEDPQFLEVKDKLKIKLIKIDDKLESYYVFIKILE